jgi:hypothetical protein
LGWAGLSWAALKDKLLNDAIMRISIPPCIDDALIKQIFTRLLGVLIFQVCLLNFRKTLACLAANLLRLSQLANFE